MPVATMGVMTGYDRLTLRKAFLFTMTVKLLPFGGVTYLNGIKCDERMMDANSTSLTSAIGCGLWIGSTPTDSGNVFPGGKAVALLEPSGDKIRFWNG
jgi:hypothetical protein